MVSGHDDGFDTSLFWNPRPPAPAYGESACSLGGARSGEPQRTSAKFAANVMVKQKKPDVSRAFVTHSHQAVAAYLHVVDHDLAET